MRKQPNPPPPHISKRPAPPPPPPPPPPKKRMPNPFTEIPSYFDGRPDSKAKGLYMEAVERAAGRSAYLMGTLFEVLIEEIEKCKKSK